MKKRVQPMAMHNNSGEGAWQRSLGAPRKGKGRMKNGHRRTGSFSSTFDVSEQSELSHWIPSHITMRRCITFIPDEKSRGEDRKCKCGYLQSQHLPIALKNEKSSDTKWNSMQHTQSLRTDAFGEIEFVGFGQRVGKFVRVNNTTEPEDVLKLMREQWKLELPNLLISVTGGAKNFYMKARLQEVFRKGLIKAAQSTGAWIITGGTHTGVMKHVGEAVRTNAVAGRSSNKVVAIGVATWGIVNNKDELVKAEGSFPASYHLEDPPPGRAALDPNHSHFILVDDGTNEQFGKEIKLRAELEKRISEHKTRASTQAPGSSSVSIPVVLLALQGGPGTLETVYQGVSNNTPAVIVEGSGGAADIIAYGFNHSPEDLVAVEGHVGKKEIVGHVDKQLQEELRAKLAAEFGGNDPKKLDKWTMWVVESIKKKQLLSIFEIDSRESAKNIDVAMLRALLRANKDDYQHQLKLALAWNRSDIAETDIFTADRRWKQGELVELMYSAILEDKVNFVKLFLENGISLKDFLTVRRLQKLYSEIPQSGILFDMLQKQLRERTSTLTLKKSMRRPSTAKISVTMDDVGHVIQSLMGEIYVPLYERNPDRYSPDVDPSVLCEDPTRELFLFCVLLNRQEMARLFWEEGKEGVAAALVASKLLKSMAQDDTELSEEMLGHADKFEELALGVLNECWGEDELRTQLLLVRELYFWGELTCLRIAISGHHLNFIAHSACQALLNNIWMGKMALDTSMIRLFTCIFIPPLVPALIYFREDQKEEETLIEPLGTGSHNESISPARRPVVARTRTTAGMIVDDIPEGQELNKSMEMVVVHSGGSGFINRRQAPPVPHRDLGEEEEEYEAPLTEEGELDFRSSGKKIGLLTRFYLFYDAPITTFMHNVLSYILFLCLYSVVILTEFEQGVLSPIDYTLVVWIFTLICEEIRQLITTEARSVSGKLLEYVGDYWNLFDLANIVTFIVAFAFRFFDSTFTVARVLYNLNLMIFFFRLLHIFYISKEMGPKLIMIARMLKDLIFFIFILMIFILAYGVASQAILYPHETRGFLHVVRGILHKAYFHVYGELFLDELMNDGFTCQADDAIAIATDDQRCPSDVGTWLVPILLGLYMLVTNVLLLNLLIAMFGYTFEKVQENTDQIWKFQRYDLIKEYSDRPPLAPPVIIFSHIFLLFRAMIMGCCKKCAPGEHVMKVKLEEAERKQLILWEYLNSENYLQQTRREQSQETDERVRQTQEEVDELKELANEQDDRLTRLEEQMLKSTMALDSIVQSQVWIIKSLQQNNLAAKEPPPELELSPAEKAPRPALPSLTREPTTMNLGKRPKTQQKGRRRTLDGQPIQEIHQKARTSPYPCCDVQRCPVPDDKVPWEVPFSSYRPVNYTADCVLAGPAWADVDLMSMTQDERPFLMYNQMDTLSKGAVDRTSLIGTYKVDKKLPLNPKGRTGMVGRGLLGRFGPNHAADPVVTRWKRDNLGNKEVHSDTGRNVLEFVAIQRKDNSLWAIPGGMVEPGENLSMTLKNEFGEEALGKLEKTDQERKDMTRKLDKLFQQGKEVFKGYSDDPRNTDNAWIETTAINYHDEEGYLMQNFTLQAGDDAGAVRWQDVDGNTPLFASHQAILKHVAAIHNAHF